MKTNTNTNELTTVCLFTAIGMAAISGNISAFFAWVCCFIYFYLSLLLINDSKNNCLLLERQNLLIKKMIHALTLKQNIGEIMHEARVNGIKAAEKDYIEGIQAGLLAIKAQYSSYALDAAVNAYTARMTGLRAGVVKYGAF